MRYHFELYVLGDRLTIQHWKTLLATLRTHLGPLGKYDVVFSCTDNVVRYFISSSRDLGVISNGVDGLVLRPIGQKDMALPMDAAKGPRVRFITGGNLLDLKEKYAVKHGRDLRAARFSVQPFGADRALTSAELFFHDGGGWTKSHKAIASLPLQLWAVDFAGNSRYLKKSLPSYLNIEKSLHLLSTEKVNALFQVDTFPYFSRDCYLNLTAYDFDRHSLIVGASGSGKSKLISLIVDRLAATALSMNYRVIVIDPHASIAADFRQIRNQRVVTFGAQDGANLFPGTDTDLTAATELTATLFKSVLADQFNSRLDRLLRYALFVLMTAQTMSLENLKRFLTDVQYRDRVTGHVDGYVPPNVIKYFGADFNEIRTQYYETTILPLVSMVDEMQLQPSLVGESQTSLAQLVRDNFLTVFSLNKVSMGDKVVKTVAGLLIQQIFLLAQARVLGQKLILIIDEVSVVQNPTIAQILAEARKFNLTIILTQQYFGQVEKDLRDAVFANAYNYYTFKVSEEDARTLEGNLTIELPEEIVKAQHAKGISETETRVRMMTELHPRQCLVRMTANGLIVPAIRATTVDAPQAAASESAGFTPAAAGSRPLPEKYNDQPPAGTTGQPAGTASAAALPPTAPQTPPEAPATGVLGSLKDLLTAHSSSRLNLKKKD